jgi:hypothetical protein
MEEAEGGTETAAERSVPPALARDLPAHLQGAAKHRLHLRPCFVAQVVDVMERIKSSTRTHGRR